MSGDPRSEGIHEELRDDLAAYALGALSTNEADAVAAHLRGCDACNSHVEWLGRAVDLLPASAPQLDPPPSLKRSLMAEVKADVKRERAAERSSRGWRGILLRPAMGIAAGVVLVAGAIAGYELGPNDSAANVSTVAAVPTTQAGGVTMKGTLVRTGDEGRLHVENLPQLDGKRVYQTWLQVDGKMVASTPFVVRQDGTNEVAIDGDLSTASAVLVTTEPNGGSTVPTTKPILEADLK
jgi:anti-sigma-K factor RskA